MAETAITFTLGQLYATIIGSCALISAVWGVIALILRAVGKAKAPEQLQNDRIKCIEDRLAVYDKRFAQDDERLKAIESCTKLSQRALLALLSHGIDGNEVEEMRKAKKSIEDYLINR